MSDDKVESGQEQTEVPEAMQPPEFSNASDDSQNSQSAAEGQDPAGLEARILKEVDKRLQSSKDIRFRKFEDRLDKQDGMLGALEGILPDDVLAKYAPDIQRAEYERKVDEMYSGRSPSSSSTSDGSQEWEKTQKHVKDIFVRAGFADSSDNVLNSPDYIAFYKMHSGNFEDGMDMLAKAGEYVAGSKAPAKVVSPAAVAQSPGGASATQSVEGDTDNYRKDMLAARGDKTQLRAIKEAARESGVDVDNIGFR